MSNWQQQVQERCAKDTQFCVQLKTDATAACQTAGISVPAGCTIQCHLDSQDCMNVVLQEECCCSEPAAKVAQRAYTDTQFKAQLKSNPQAACKQVLGTQMAPTMQVCVFETNDKCCHVVLPQKGTYSVQSVRK